MQWGCLCESFRMVLSYGPFVTTKEFLASERCKVPNAFLEQLLILGYLDLSFGFIFGHPYGHGTLQKVGLDSNSQHGHALAPSIMVGHHGPTPVVRVA